MTGEPSTFVIDTSGVGAGTLSITVDGPSKVDLSCNEVEEGYEVRYTPMVPGKYFVTVKYNGKNVKGSPFSVNVGGDNLGGGNSSLRNLHSKEESRTSSMTMETMQRTSYIRHQVQIQLKYSNCKLIFKLRTALFEFVKSEIKKQVLAKLTDILRPLPLFSVILFTFIFKEIENEKQKFVRAIGMHPKPGTREKSACVKTLNFFFCSF